MKGNLLPSQAKPSRGAHSEEEAAELFADISQDESNQLSTQLVLVRRLYEAFLKADFKFIADSLHTGFRCQIMGKAGIPYAGEYDEFTLSHLLCTLRETYTFAELRPERFFEDGREVVVKGYVNAIVLGTGKPVETKWMLAIEFMEDKLLHVEAYFDTLGAYQAMTR